jgi:Nuclease-related domain
VWALRIRWWEGAILIVPSTLALLFFLAGSPAPGLVLTALVAVGFASRAQIPGRNEAGGHARTQSLLLSVQATALAAVYILIVVAFFVMWRGHWTRDRHGTVAFYALAGLAFFLARECFRLSRDADNWWLGSEMERQVACHLDELRSEGWSVVHDLPRDGGGNVDHFLTGPRGAFAIETKRGRDRAGARGQAVSNAVWAREKFGERWVTAILCVRTDPPPQPTKRGHVWVVGVADLVPLLRRGNL